MGKGGWANFSSCRDTEDYCFPEESSTGQVSNCLKSVEYSFNFEALKRKIPPVIMLIKTVHTPHPAFKKQCAHEHLRGRTTSIPTVHVSFVHLF